jgi:hypothetical protein
MEISLLAFIPGFLSIIGTLADESILQHYETTMVRKVDVAEGQRNPTSPQEESSVVRGRGK